MKNRIMPLAWIMALLLMAGCGGGGETSPAEKETGSMVPGDTLATVSAEEAVPAAVPAAAQVETVATEVMESVPVEVAPEVEAPVGVPQTGPYSLQLGSFLVTAHADDLAARIRQLGYEATVEAGLVRGQYFNRVFVRGLPDRAAARKLGTELRDRLDLDYLILRK